MAINYVLGQSYDVGGSAQTNAANIMPLIKTAIVANSAWSTVEDVTIGSSNFHWMAFKCDHTVSGLTADFYLIIINQTGTATIQFYLGETYTSGASRVLGKFVPASAVSAYTPQADGSASSTMTAAANGSPTVAGTPAWYSASFTVTPSCAYQIFVYPDHVIININNTGAPLYLGAFTSLVYSAATNDPLPLMIGGLQASSGSLTVSVGGATTRHPLQGGVASTNNLWGLSYPFSYNYSMTSIYQNGTSTVGYAGFDLLQNSTTPLSENLLFMIGGANSLAGAKAQGLLRGKLNNARIMTSPPAGMVIGDTISFNGTHWAVVTYSGSVVLLADTGV